jgi:hypothetical protein
MAVEVELLYRQHLTEGDRRLLGALGSGDNRDLDSLLGDPALEAALLDPDTGGGGLAETSPFLTFAVAVHRSAARLAGATYVEERWAPRQRVPVFDVAPMRDLLAEPHRRFFLVELLASYTHVASGATWERTRRGWRRRRFSELDPVRLAELLEAVPEPDRPGVYRRLGDLALFLTGVFPDHIGLSSHGTDRLLRLSGWRVGPDDRPAAPELLEALGRRWYLMAAAAAVVPLPIVEEMGRRFGDARRVLNVVTDWYLFPLRERWFGRG